MLVLSRKLGERVRVRTPLGEVIWIQVVDIDRGKVRLGFEAEPGVKIHRQELLVDCDDLPTEAPQ